MTTTTPLDDETVRAFHDRVHGDVLHPGDEGYEAARTVFNGMIDKYPSYVVRATGAADVMAAVDFARDHDLPLAVKGGGHNFAGTAVCDDGLVIDCSRMDSVRVDPDAQTARVGPGTTWADVDHETQALGLATTGGLVSHTGVAGLTLGGGQGYLARKHGLTIDNLRGADVVTADGELVHASVEENADLFWGLRGGGGNFGVVTSFEFDLHPVGQTVLGGPVFHPYEDAAEALRFYREFTTDAPKELACYALIVRVPPEDPFPEAYRGDPRSSSRSVTRVRPTRARTCSRPSASSETRSSTRSSRCPTPPSSRASTTARRRATGGTRSPIISTAFLTVQSIRSSSTPTRSRDR